MSREAVHLILVLMGDVDSIKIANNLFLKHKAGDLIPASIKKPVISFFHSLGCLRLHLN